MEQLKGYFSEDLTLESDIYADLLDYGRHGDIAKWLLEMGEADMASYVDSIDTSLSDSSFYGQLKAAITGLKVSGPDIANLKPTFGKCFSFEGMKCDVKDNEATVSVSFKVLMCVNEAYELSVSSNWGTRAEMINPSNHPEGQIACFVFTLRKRPGKKLGEITVGVDGKNVLPLDSSSSPRFDGKLEESSVSSNNDIISYDIKGVHFNLIKVESGTFLMGDGYNDSYEHTPVHTVKITKDYYIGETLVTRRLFNAVMPFHNHNWEKDEQTLDLPATGVSWKETLDFVKCLNKISKCQFDLPTEAEWEYAAMGGTYSKGFVYSGSDILKDVAWTYNELMNEMKGQLQKVAQKKPNELGLYDMSGLALEWCLDWHGEYPGDILQENPKGPSTGDWKVVRGGYSACFKSELPQYRICHRDSRDSNREQPETLEKIQLPVSFRVVLRDYNDREL